MSYETPEIVEQRIGVLRKSTEAVRGTLAFESVVAAANFVVAAAVDNELVGPLGTRPANIIMGLICGGFALRNYLDHSQQSAELASLQGALVQHQLAIGVPPNLFDQDVVTNQ